jgi:phosphoribosylformylglycinamidine cyclo-ligase
LDRQVPEFGRALGEELLEPTRVYARDLLALTRTRGVDVHALSHVTGGGLAANLARVLPQDAFARLDRSTWTPPAVFEVVREVGQVPLADLERTLNMGVGFVAVLPAAHSELAIKTLKTQGIEAWLLGQVSDLSSAQIQDGVEVVRGTKGVDGGSVQVVGTSPR